jgi:hypothetical protein
MPAPRTAEPSVADAVKAVGADLQRRRLVEVVKIGVRRKLTLAELVRQLPPEEKGLLESVLGPISSSALLEWLKGPGETHLDAVLVAKSPKPKPKAKPRPKRRTNGAPRRPAGQAKLPGIDSRKKPETAIFDKTVVALIATFSDGAKSGELKRQLGCTRGKLRLALERSKTHHWILQKGALNGARYFATAAGLQFAETSKPKDS